MSSSNAIEAGIEKINELREENKSLRQERDDLKVALTEAQNALRSIDALIDNHA